MREGRERERGTGGVEVIIHSLSLDSDDSWDGADEANEFPVASDTHPTVPHLLPPWGHERPPEEHSTVVKPEHVVFVFHVILVEQRVHLVQLRSKVICSSSHGHSLRAHVDLPEHHLGDLCRPR